MWACVITLHLSSSSPSVNFSYFHLLLWNHWTDLVQIGNPTWLPGSIMCSDWLKLWKSSCQKLLSWWNCNIIEMMSGWSSTKFVIFVPIAYPRWSPQSNNSLPLDPMGISFKDLFMRNYLTNWIFCIMWMFLGWFYTCSIVLVQIGNPTWLPGPIMCSNWLKLWRSFCQKPLSPWNCYIIEMMTGWSSAKFVIFLLIAYRRWPPQGNLVYHWTLWEFHSKTFLWETTRQIEYFALFECSLDGSIPDLLFWSRSEIARSKNAVWLVETLKIFLSETTQPMELWHRDDDWVVLYQPFYFCVERKSKMAITRQFILPLDPMGISLKIEAYGNLY
jgi:hypothetical protein